MVFTNMKSKCFNGLHFQQFQVPWCRLPKKGRRYWQSFRVGMWWEPPTNLRFLICHRRSAGIRKNSLRNTILLFSSKCPFPINVWKHDYNLNTLIKQYREHSGQVIWTQGFPKSTATDSHAKLRGSTQCLWKEQLPWSWLTKCWGDGNSPPRQSCSEHTSSWNQHTGWSGFTAKHVSSRFNKEREQEGDTKFWQNRKFEETISET